MSDTLSTSVSFSEAVAPSMSKPEVLEEGALVVVYTVVVVNLPSVRSFPAGPEAPTAPLVVPMFLIQSSKMRLAMKAHIPAG